MPEKKAKRGKKNDGPRCMHYNLGENSTQMECPYCHAQIHTHTKAVAGLLTWMVSAFLCLVGCVCGCCLIPFLMFELKDVEHYCPNCNALVGRYRRLD